MRTTDLGKITGQWAIASVLLIVAAQLGLGATRVDSSETARAQAANGLPPAPRAPLENTLKVRLSPAMNEVLKLSKASVSPEVILAYIKSQPGPYHPSASQIIALKEAGLAPDVLLAMVQHRPAPRQISPQPAVSQYPHVAQPQTPTAYPTAPNGVPPPASYEPYGSSVYTIPYPTTYSYWYYYYNYPRFSSFSYWPYYSYNWGPHVGWSHFGHPHGHRNLHAHFTPGHGLHRVGANHQVFANRRGTPFAPAIGNHHRGFNAGVHSIQGAHRAGFGPRFAPANFARPAMGNSAGFRRSFGMGAHVGSRPMGGGGFRTAAFAGGGGGRIARR